jgi:hypothetical protein
MRYYVYAYLREDNTPYYIGKGSGKRAWAKGKGEVGKSTNPSRIIIVEKNLTLTGSLAIERRLIRWYGRIDLGTGILRNQTDGGDGGRGARPGNKISKETREKISIAKKGKKTKPMSEVSKKKLSESMKGKNVGRKWTEERKQQLSIQLSGRKRNPLSEDTKEKLRLANLGKTRGPMDEEHKRKISESLRGKERTKEHSKKLSIALKGRVPTQSEREAYLRAMEEGKTTCEHCGKNATKGNYIRWHGDRCKILSNVSSDTTFSKPYLTGETPV